jgi:hypothetical protein
MIYGDSPARINERQDPLGLNIYTYAPDINAIRQSSNLYVYCGNNPLMYIDPTGEAWYHWVIGGVIVVAAAAAVVVTAGGALPALYAVGSVASGVAAGSMATTLAAGAFIGSSAVYGVMALDAAVSSKSIKDFNAKGNWGTVAFTAGGLLVGGAAGYTVYKNNNITAVGKGSTGRTEAKNLNEQLAMKQVYSNPLQGAKQLNIAMSDSRWLAKDGWVKMSQNVNGTEIHFVYNTITKVFDDFKFK